MLLTRNSSVTWVPFESSPEDADLILGGLSFTRASARLFTRVAGGTLGHSSVNIRAAWLDERARWLYIPPAADLSHPSNRKIVNCRYPDHPRGTLPWLYGMRADVLTWELQKVFQCWPRWI
jgi:hypothetical protein